MKKNGIMMRAVLITALMILTAFYSCDGYFIDPGVMGVTGGFGGDWDWDWGDDAGYLIFNLSGLTSVAGWKINSVDFDEDQNPYTGFPIYGSYPFYHDGRTEPSIDSSGKVTIKIPLDGFTEYEEWVSSSKEFFYFFNVQGEGEWDDHRYVTKKKYVFGEKTYTLSLNDLDSDFWW